MSAPDSITTLVADHDGVPPDVVLGQADLTVSIGCQGIVGSGFMPSPVLEWAHAIVWDADRADDDLWRRLHEHFDEAELVDLGCAIGFELGYQHWRRTIGLAARD